VASLISIHKAVTICIQEVYDHQVKYLADALDGIVTIVELMDKLTG
jgi:hypothetical protein